MHQNELKRTIFYLLFILFVIMVAATSPVVLAAIPPNISITFPQNGSVVNQSTIFGQADPEVNVTVYVYGREASVIADVYGGWSYIDATLPEGSHSVYAVATDAQGNSQTTPVNNFILDTSRPKVLDNIFPGESTTQVSLDTSLRVIVMDSSPLEELSLSNAITLWQKSYTVTQGVYGEVLEMVSGTVYSSVYTLVYEGQSTICQELVFKPEGLLKSSTSYQARVNPQVKDVAGNGVYPRQWGFTTVGGLTTDNPHGNYLENVNTCVNCHTPHRGTSPRIVEPRGNLPLLDDYCNACHDGTAAPVPDNWRMGKRHDYRIVREGTAGASACTACHDPHLRWTPQNPNLLQDFYHYAHNDPTNPFIPDSSEQALCGECHETAIEDDPRVVYERFYYNKWNTSSGTIGNYSLCLHCHNGTTATDILTYYQGPSRHIIQAQDGSKLQGRIPCADCHATHGSDNLRLLKGEIGHNKGQQFQTGGTVWDPLTERSFCITCHNNSTELYGIVVGFVYDIPGHEWENTQACSECHGGTTLAAAHAPQ